VNFRERNGNPAQAPPSKPRSANAWRLPVYPRRLPLATFIPSALAVSLAVRGRARG
jgi:hypothetical protein